MSFKDLWKGKNWHIIGGLIGLVIGTIIVAYVLTYQGECWECILFLLPLIPFEPVFERVSSGVIQVVLAYGFLIVEYTLIGVVFGFILNKVKRKLKNKK